MKESYYQPRKLPISLKEIKDYDGKCFLLETDEVATIDQQSQGEITLTNNKDIFCKFWRALQGLWGDLLGTLKHIEFYMNFQLQ